MILAVAVLVAGAAAAAGAWIVAAVLVGAPILVVPAVLWSTLDRMIARELATFGQPAFDPRTARLWPRRPKQ